MNKKHCNALLPLVLERGYAACPDMTALSRRLAELYGADLGVDLSSAGPDRVLSADICGIKDTVDTISHTRKVIRAVRKVNPEFSVLSGFDEYYLVNRASGGNGVLCGLTNVEPELFVRLHGAYQAGDFATAIECAKRISSLMAVYDACDLFVSAIKVAVNIKGLPISTAIFDPAIQASDDQKATIEQLLS